MGVLGQVCFQGFGPGCSETFWLWLRLLPWMLVLPASALANNEVLKKVKFLTFFNAFFNAPLKI